MSNKKTDDYLQKKRKPFIPLTGLGIIMSCLRLIYSYPNFDLEMALSIFVTMAVCVLLDSHLFGEKKNGIQKKSKT